MLLAFKKCEGGKMRWGIEVAHEVEEWVGEKRPRIEMVIADVLDVKYVCMRSSSEKAPKKQHLFCRRMIQTSLDLLLAAKDGRQREREKRELLSPPSWPRREEKHISGMTDLKGRRLSLSQCLASSVWRRGLFP